MTRWTTILLASLIALQGAPVAAQMACGSHASIMIQLDRDYGEVRQGRGLTGLTILELWVSEATGTWTILDVYPSGMACVKAVGKLWRADAKEPKGKRS